MTNSPLLVRQKVIAAQSQTPGILVLQSNWILLPGIMRLPNWMLNTHQKVHFLDGRDQKVNSQGDGKLFFITCTLTALANPWSFFSQIDNPRGICCEFWDCVLFYTFPWCIEIFLEVGRWPDVNLTYSMTNISYHRRLSFLFFFFPFLILFYLFVLRCQAF